MVHEFLVAGCGADCVQESNNVATPLAASVLQPFDGNQPDSNTVESRSNVGQKMKHRAKVKHPKKKRKSKKKK